jgi:hypothetical protein
MGEGSVEDDAIVPKWRVRLAEDESRGERKEEKLPLEEMERSWNS